MLSQFTDGKSPPARGSPATCPQHLGWKESSIESVLYMGREIGVKSGSSNYLVVRWFWVLQVVFDAW